MKKGLSCFLIFTTILFTILTQTYLRPWLIHVKVIINHWSPIGAGFGMGHLIMLNGKSYRFGERGQFWIIRSGEFSMQGETVGINKRKGNITLNYHLNCIM